MSSTGLAGSYVYFRSAQEEGTGNSVGEGLAFRDRKCFLLGTPPRAGHRPRPLLFVWAQQRLLFWWPSSSPLWEIWWVSPGGPFRDGKSLHTPHSLWLGRKGGCKSLGCSAWALAELLDQVSPDSSFMLGPPQSLVLQVTLFSPPAAPELFGSTRRQLRRSWP